MLASLHIMINHSQLIMYLPSVERPGHIWGDAELDQGFAWSPGIVSLGVPEHAFICLVQIDVVRDFELSSDAISCVRVPFEIDKSPVFVGSVYHYDPVYVESGKYSLYYEAFPGQGTARIGNCGQMEVVEISNILKISLVPNGGDAFEVLKAGGRVQSNKVLSRLSEIARAIGRYHYPENHTAAGHNTETARS